jgi:hypothetical protein
MKIGSMMATNISVITQSVPAALSRSFMDLYKVAEKTELPGTQCFQLRVSKGTHCLSCFSSYAVSVLFLAYLMPHFVPSVIDFTVSMAPNRSIKVFSSIPKCQKAVVCLLEKIHALDTFYSTMNYVISYE